MLCPLFCRLSEKVLSKQQSDHPGRLSAACEGIERSQSGTLDSWAGTWLLKLCECLQCSDKCLSRWKAEARNCRPATLCYRKMDSVRVFGPHSTSQSVQARHTQKAYVRILWADPTGFERQSGGSLMSPDDGRLCVSQRTLKTAFSSQETGFCKGGGLISSTQGSSNSVIPRRALTLPTHTHIRHTNSTEWFYSFFLFKKKILLYF